jgi:hypothetical protein
MVEEYNLEEEKKNEKENSLEKTEETKDSLKELLEEERVSTATLLQTVEKNPLSPKSIPEEEKSIEESLEQVNDVVTNLNLEEQIEEENLVLNPSQESINYSTIGASTDGKVSYSQSNENSYIAQNRNQTDTSPLRTGGYDAGNKKEGDMYATSGVAYDGSDHNQFRYDERNDAPDLRKGAGLEAKTTKKSFGL